MRVGAERSSVASARGAPARDIARMAAAATVVLAVFVAVFVVLATMAATAAAAGATAAAPGPAAGVTRIGAPILRAEPAAKAGRLTALSAETTRPRLFVRMRADAGSGEAEASFASLGFRVVQQFRPLGIWVVEYVGSAGTVDARGSAEGRASAEVGATVVAPAPGEFDLSLAEQALRDAPGVGWVESAGVRRFDLVPDDPFYLPEGGWPGQYGPPAVGLERAWDVTTGSRQVVAAFLDTGIGGGIPDFAGRIVSPYSVPYDSTLASDWEDIEGHGSGTAGVAAALGDNGVGVAGAAWSVGIMPVQLSDVASFSVENEIEGLMWAVEHGADVINLSLGSSEPDLAELDAIRYAIDSGVTVVASAGNEGPGVGIEYPAGYPGVISVGATDRWNVVADYSNTGSGLDLVAPGTDVLTWAVDSKGYYIALTSGTSFAAPMVTGIAALMLTEAPDLTPHQVVTMLRETATDLGPAGRDESSGSGLVNAAAAVAAAAEWQSTTHTTLPPRAFPDVPAGHPYAPAIDALSRAGVIEGYTDGRFGVHDLVTRQQFAKMIVLALGETASEDSVAPFQDVPPTFAGLYPDHYIARAFELGITAGTSIHPPLYSPGKNITRAQVTTMAVRGATGVRPGFLEAPPLGFLPTFGRFSLAHDGAAAGAYWNGLLQGLQGMGPGYDMWRSATRGEVAEIIAPLLSAR